MKRMLLCSLLLCLCFGVLPHSTVQAAASANYQDGIYSAATEGMMGDVTVTLTIKDNRIIEVIATGPNETQGIGTMALEQMPERIISANGISGIDTVAGATITSKAILEAANTCLAIAQGLATPTPLPTVTPTPTPTSIPAATPSIPYQDGTYSASAEGFNGHVTVTITVSDGKVKKVLAVGPGETQGIATPALEQMPERIISTNGTNGVDTVAGATITSKAILEAANTCLAIAQGLATPTPLPTATPVPTPTSVPATTPSIPYQDGTYSASAEGFNGHVTVTITVSSGKVKKVLAVGPGETQGIATPALEQMPERIISANGTNGVDTVAGATITSKAILEAANTCLAIAQGLATPTPLPTATPTTIPTSTPTASPTPTPTTIPTSTPTAIPTPANGNIVIGESEFSKMPAVDKPTLIFTDSAQLNKPVYLKYEELETKESNTALYDVQIVDEYGNELDLLNEVTLCLPYPNGISKDNIHTYRITIRHYGKGNTEIFSLSDGSIEPTKQGLCIRISSLSPFEITWEKLPESITLPKTGDNSRLLLWSALLTLAGAALLTLKRKIA